MIAFHGTGGDRRLIDAIFTDGLRPAPRPWAHELTGIENHVFASTTPIGSKGGDPIHFAQRRAWRTARAWLVVIEIDPDLVHGAVPNGELERYWQVKSFATIAFADGGHASRAVLAAMRRLRAPARDLLRYRVRSVVDGLCAGPPDGATLVQFEQAYHRATDKARVAASYNLQIPSWFADDAHYPWCMGCLHQLFEVEVVAPTAGDVAFGRGAWDRLDLTTFGAMFDLLDRWLVAVGDPPLPNSLDELQRRYPPPRELVPRVVLRDFVTADLAIRMREPDTQLLLAAVPPSSVLGAIDLGTRDRLSSLVRPHRGEVLIDKLHYLARELARRERPTVLVD